MGSIEAEFRRYRQLGTSALGQLDPADLTRAAVGSSNLPVTNTLATNTLATISLATIAWHVAGNLWSRCTEFLTSDGEKVWRDREPEFAARTVSPDALLQHWDSG